MNANEYEASEKTLCKQLSDNEQQLKLTRNSLEDYKQLAKESRAFLQETATLFISSSDSHLFSAILEEQLHLDKRIISSLEGEEEELIGEHKRLLLKQDELFSHQKKEKS